MNHTAPKDPKDANSMFGAKLLLGEIRRKFYGNLLVSTERDQKSVISYLSNLLPQVAVLKNDAILHN